MKKIPENSSEAPKSSCHSDERISYENKKFIEYEKHRKGPGENGIKAELTDPEEIKKNEEWLRKEGFSVIVSDKISLDRALVDWRPPA